MMECLTARERQVVELLARGMSDTQIAEAMKISRRTLWEYTYRVRQKTGIRSTRELAIEAALFFFMPA